MTNLYNKRCLIPCALVSGMLAVFPMVQGCGTGRQEPFTPHSFPMPEIPSMIVSGDDAVQYAAVHFWDRFTDTSEFYPCDSSLVNGVKKEDVEQAFSNWIAILQQAGSDVAGKAVSGLFDEVAQCEEKDTASTVFEYLSYLADKYFYDPNSPVRSEDLYLPFVSRMASYSGFTQTQRMRYEFEARMCSLNRTGTEAADFRFCDKNGKIHTLHGLEADYTLLFFSNPGCEACKYIIDRFKSDPDISGLVSSGKLAVANIYIDDDLQSWYDYQKIYPEEWYNGYDPDFIIRTDLLYNVRAIPSLYLLDKDKKVLLKDAPEDIVFSALHSIAGQ